MNREGIKMNDEIKKKLDLVHSKCVEIVKIIDQICVENDIDYSLCGGSVIGAHLYNGFIPWDDDIDIMMTRKNYDKFLAIAPGKLPDEFKLLKCDPSQNTNVLFSKIIDENSTMVEKSYDGSHKISGVFVDIGVFDKIPNKKWLRIYDTLLMKLMHIAFIGHCSDKSFKSFMKNGILLFIGNKRKQLFEKLENMLRKNDRLSEYSYAEYFYGLTILYDKQIFENYDRIEFEGQSFMIVRDYMDYLETRYGRREFYREDDNAVPPHLVYVNLEMPYKEFDISQLSSVL